ncbi:MAG: hypothetical protein ACYTF0_00875 [Planctomycetota bacterium]
MPSGPGATMTGPTAPPSRGATVITTAPFTCVPVRIAADGHAEAVPGLRFRPAP